MTASVAQPFDLMEWAEQLTRINQFGTKEYPPFVCHIMNMFDPRVRECACECKWISPYGFVPEEGCAIHD